MKLFITGISGLLGLNFALQVKNRFEVSGCYLAHPVELEGVRTFRQDVTDFNSLEELLMTLNPDVIVHTAGLTNVEECELNPMAAHRIHVLATRHIAQIARALEARLVHISTDHLFSGATPWITESAPPDPLNVYARTKWESEQVAREFCQDVLIVRTNFYGWGTTVRVSFSDWIFQSLAGGRPLSMFTDVFFTPILLNDLIDVVAGLVDRQAVGVYHVAGAERLSKYSFAVQMADIFNQPRDPIHAASVNSFPFKAARPGDMSLCSKKAEKFLRIQMPDVGQGLKKLKGLEQKGWPRVLEEAVQMPARLDIRHA